MAIRDICCHPMQVSGWFRGIFLRFKSAQDLTNVEKDELKNEELSLRIVRENHAAITKNLKGDWNLRPILPSGPVHIRSGLPYLSFTIEK